MERAIADSNGEIPESVVRWLFQVIQPIYKHDPRATFHDCMVTLSQFKQLRPRTRVFTDIRGQSKLLLCLYGRINDIPVVVWVRDSYPMEHPLLFIDLEQLDVNEKLVKSDLVAIDGTLHLDIFDHWDPMTCNIAQIIQSFNELPREIVIGSSMQGNQSPDIHSPPPLPPKPKMNNGGSVSSRLIPQKLVNNVPPGSKPIKNYVANIDLMDTDNLGNDTTHTELLENLQQLLDEMSRQEQSRLKDEDSTYQQRYKDVIQKFNDNLQYETNMVKYVTDSVTQYKQDLQSQITALRTFKENKLQKVPQDVDQVIATANDTLYQLVSLDLSLTDAIQLCNQMLNKGILSVDHFIRETRLLGTKQFLVRDAIATQTTRSSTT